MRPGQRRPGRVAAHADDQTRGAYCVWENKKPATRACAGLKQSIYQVQCFGMLVC